MMDNVQKRLLEEVAGLHDVPQGAYSLRVNGELYGKNSSENIEIAACETFKYSEPGDIILHMGPLIAYDRLTTVEKIMKGLDEGSKKYD